MNPNRDITMYFDDIIESAERIVSNLKSLTLQDFRNDINIQDAVIRRFQVIGEATKHIPEEIKNQYPDIPWKDITGFRDVLIHDYPEVVIDYVFTTAKEHLPIFKNQIEKVLKNLK